MASVNVLVRARPLSQRELDAGTKVILKMEKLKTYLNYSKFQEDDEEKKVRGSFTQKQFLFDRSFWSVNKEDPHFADQLQIFSEFGVNIVKSALDGYNACMFAYGQTGSGKTHTMMGKIDEQGLIPRICQSLFDKLKENRDADSNFSYRVEVSYMEIYNEHVRDLLRPPQKSQTGKIPTLKVREHPKEGPFVQDLSSHPVLDYSSIESLLRDGNNLRVTAATNMNSISSRSHAIFTIKLTQAKFCGNIPSETVSKVHLVDLAGSERVASSGATGVRLKEGGNINKSLVTLGLIIAALAENSIAHKEKSKIPRRPAFVPYRDSVLTWLLKDSIGGNSKTVMIATVSPADIHYAETLSTLRYASRARKIVNKPVINEDPNVKIIRELRAEIDKLKNTISSNRKGSTSSEAGRDIEAKLKMNEMKAEKLMKNWLQRNEEAQKIFEEKSLSLSLHGQQTVLRSSKPHLVGLDVDPLSTDIVIYHLEIGKTVIGSRGLSEEQGIALEGSGIESEHCFLDVNKTSVSIHPIAPLIYVNNKLVETAIELAQGDVIRFGHYLKFRFNHPGEAAVLREKRRSGLFSPTEGRMSPAVMKHYRSLDSGLSSPDDLEHNQHTSSRHDVMNSTTVSNGTRKLPQLTSESSYDSSSTSFNHAAKISRLKSSSMMVIQKDNELETTDHSDGNNSFVEDSTRQRKARLKSASASNVLGNQFGKTNSFSNMVPQMRIDLADEIYLSHPELLDCSDLSSVASPRNVSLSELSLSTDDLACNLLLQSQLNASSPIRPKDNTHLKHALDLPAVQSRSQSLIDISAQRNSTDHEEGLLRAESMFDVSGDSFNDSMDLNGSMLAIEVKEAADTLDLKRQELKILIENYRAAEIERVQTENENLKRATENEEIFRSQQQNLEGLFKQQKIQLEQARVELDDYNSKAVELKDNERKVVEVELDRLMELKQKHLVLVNGTETELRKKKFKLKCKIEEYWKRMDLYDNLFIELELDQNKVRRESDGKILEKVKMLDLQNTEEMEKLREEIKISEEHVEIISTRVDDEKNLKVQLVNDLQDTKKNFLERIKSAEDFHKQLQHEYEEIEKTKCEEIEKLDEKIREEEDKYFKFTIYKMHECVDDSCCSEEHNNLFNESEDCKLKEEKQRKLIDEIILRRTEKEATFNERLKKYSEMTEDAEYSVVQLRATSLLEIEKFNTDIASKDDLIEELELQCIEETKTNNDLSNELRARERPRSRVAEPPEESEEDILALELQKEQLVQSKNKIKKILEDALKDEFADLNTTSSPSCENWLDGEANTTTVDRALNLIFHSGSTPNFTKGVVSKHVQYEQRKQLLLDIKDELSSLMRHQVNVHQEVATNFMAQKSVFEDMRSKERQDIHTMIQTLIGENSSHDENMWNDVFTSESKQILEYQESLEKLENEMYLKIEENQTIQSKLDDLQQKMTSQYLILPNQGPPSLNTTLEEELDTLSHEKYKCEFLIQELRKKLDEERNEYLEMLKSKDEYDVIGQEYRDARHTFFQTEGNQAASEVLRELSKRDVAFHRKKMLLKDFNVKIQVFYASGVLERLSIDKTTCIGGWMYFGCENNVNIFKKVNVRKGMLCVIGQGIIKAPPKSVWETVRNPSTRLIYDKMVKKMNVVEHCSDNLKVVYIQHESRVMFFKQSRDCCCIHSERIENHKYVSAFKSVEHPDCPEIKRCKRSEVFPSGWIVESYTENGEDWSMVWYLMKIDFGSGLPSYFIDKLMHKIPLSIHLLRNYLVLS